MAIAKVTAIIRPDALAAMEKKLHAFGVPGMTISQVKGYGDYADYYTDDWLVTHVKIEIFIPQSQAEQLAEAIMESAHTGLVGDGLVAITPVSHVYHVRTRAPLKGSGRTKLSY